MEWSRVEKSRVFTRLHILGPCATLAAQRRPTRSRYSGSQRGTYDWSLGGWTGGSQIRRKLLDGAGYFGLQGN